MKQVFILIIALSACTGPQQKKNLSAIAREEILKLDHQMSDEAGRNGFYTTLIAYGHDSLVKPEEGNHPIIGRQSLIDKYQGKEDMMTLSWKPFKAEASSSGDMGYTLGDWILEGPDTTYFGNYFTIWKKDQNGMWKWVADGGNNTPAPGE